ncbi:hypothetical protein MASR1M8_26330 [Thermomonas brevis]
MHHIPHVFLPRRTLLALTLCVCGVPAAFAQQAAPETIDDLRKELAALRAEQAERDQRIQRLEEALQRITGTAAPAVASTPAPVAPSSTSTSPSATATVATTTPRLIMSGDLRLRTQGDRSDDDGKNRGSMQVRGRIGATFTVNERVTIGARLATGDGDDPNSTDVQLSNWLDDLDVSLDMAYAQFNFGNLTLYGGKIPQPFVRTDLVWDGDMNPQGVGATWRKPLAGGGSLRANGLAFVVDESATGPDSTMLGAQLGYESPAHGDWKFDVHGAYYHYDLGSVAGADSGDFRSNLRDASGNYLSRFQLANLLLGIGWNGLGERWPLRLVGDYVRNTGAATDADTGFGADLILGKASARGDWRFTYGYAQTDADAVLAAFSHDNIGIATNYRLHALTAEYVPWKSTTLGAIWYHYRPNDPVWAGSNAPGDWLDRFRLYLMLSF